MQRASVLVLLALSSVALAAPCLDLRDAPFSDAETKTLLGFFLNNVNIQGQGGVVASPDKQVPGGGSYNYNWMRDGAISMRTVWSYNNSISNALGLMKSYIGFVIHNQNEADPNNIDIRGEPKFLLPSGDVDPQPWCRPQNDGAAIRATTLALFANDLIDMGMSDYVAQYLWTGSSTLHGGAIKYDLDYVVSSWNANTCDLWEEVQSTDFFWDRFNQRRALLVGADFASRMGDSDSANTYQQAASTIGDLGHHFNGQYVFESTNRMQDSAVIAAFNVGYNFDGVYGPTDSRVAATISVLSAIFNQSYPINSADTNNGIPGILIGRYPGDTYGGGNPWVLLSAALAQVYYRGASEVLRSQRMPSPAFMRETVNQLALHSLAETDISSPEALALALTTLGDGVLTRIHYHTVGAGLHMPEQIDKYTGYEASATDLTWSYSAVLDALQSRSQM